MPAYARLPDSIYYADAIVTDWFDNIKEFIKNYSTYANSDDWFCSSWVNHDETWYDNEYTGNNRHLAEHHKKYNTANNALYVYNFEVLETLPDDLLDMYAVDGMKQIYYVVNVKWRINIGKNALNFANNINELYENFDYSDIFNIDGLNELDFKYHAHYHFIDADTADRGTIKFILAKQI